MTSSFGPSIFPIPFEFWKMITVGKAYKYHTSISYIYIFYLDWHLVENLVDLFEVAVDENYLIFEISDEKINFVISNGSDLAIVLTTASMSLEGGHHSVAKWTQQSSFSEICSFSSEMSFT